MAVSSIARPQKAQKAQREKIARAGKKAEEQQEDCLRSELCPLRRMSSMQHIAIIEEDAFHRHAHDEHPHIPSFCVSLGAY